MPETNELKSLAEDDSRKRTTTALVSLFIMALLSLFIPYASVILGVLVGMIGSLGLIVEKVPAMRRVWYIYLAAGVGLLAFGIYLQSLYKPQ
jgi:hypothetical protein